MNKKLKRFLRRTFIIRNPGGIYETHVWFGWLMAILLISSIAMLGYLSGKRVEKFEQQCELFCSGQEYYVTGGGGCITRNRCTCEDSRVLE